MLDSFELANLSEELQNDLTCLLSGFNVDQLENNNGQTLVELACQIIVDRIKRVS